MRDIVRQNEVAQNERKYFQNVNQLTEWLEKIEKILQQPIVTRLDDICDFQHELDVEKSDVVPEMEKIYRSASQAAQNLCRSGYAKNEIQRMLQEMTVIKDRFLNCRENIDKSVAATKGLESPLTQLENLYTAIQAWHDESEEILEGYEDPNCGMDDIEKLIELHAHQFGPTCHKEIDINTTRMRSYINDINNIKLETMNSADIENRVLNIIKQVENTRRQAAQWGPRIDGLNNKWAKLMKWIRDSEDALSESESYLLSQNHGTDKDDLEDLANKISLLLSMVPILKADFDDMRQVLTNISDHEVHCDELVPLMKETLNAILTMSESIEIDGLFKDVKHEIDSAKQVLQDIRSVLRSDGPASAIEKKNISLGKNENPIANARKLLESVTQKFKEKPEEDSLKLMEQFRNQIEELSHTEKELNDQIQCLPEKMTNFNNQIDQVNELLKQTETELLNSPEIMEEVSLKNAENMFSQNNKNRAEAVKLMEDLSGQLMELSESLPPQQLQEQEELLLSKSARCKALMKKLDNRKKYIGQARDAITLKREIDSVDIKLSSIDSELDDRDDEGNRKFIDSIVQSRKQHDQHEQIIRKYQTLQSDLLKQVDRAQEQLDCNSLPPWMGNVVQSFKDNVNTIDAKMDQRSKLLKDNLNSWIQFEEFVDQINSHLDSVEGENLGKSGSLSCKYESLHAVDQQMKQLLKHKENMVSLIYNTEC